MITRDKNLLKRLVELFTLSLEEYRGDQGILSSSSCLLFERFLVGYKIPAPDTLVLTYEGNLRGSWRLLSVVTINIVFGDDKLAIVYKTTGHRYEALTCSISEFGNQMCAIGVSFPTLDWSELSPD